MITHSIHDLKNPPKWARLVSLIALGVTVELLGYVVIALFRTGYIVISLLAGTFGVVGTLVMLNIFKMQSSDSASKVVASLLKFWRIMFLFQLLIAVVLAFKVPSALRTTGYDLINQALVTDNFDQSLSLLKNAQFLGVDVITELTEELDRTLNTLNPEMDRRAVQLAQLYVEIASDTARRNQIGLIRASIKQGIELDTNQAGRLMQVMTILDPD